MTAFLVIGAVGLALLLLSLVLGEVFEGLLGGFDVDAGGGVFSGPVIGAFLASFGFGAALVLYSTDVGAGGAALGGLGSGIVVGGLALVMMRSLVNMPTDETVTTQGLAGAPGIVITTIPDEGYGEVTIRHHGEQRKYNARAAARIGAGATVRVTAVLSTSAVMVEPAEPSTES
jgi:membrane protein implicated in regulation of membrane protease activity